MKDDLFQRRLMGVVAMGMAGGSLYSIFLFVIAIGGQTGAILATMALSIAAGILCGNQSSLWDKKRKLFIRAPDHVIQALLQNKTSDAPAFVSNEPVRDAQRVTLAVECIEHFL